MRHFQSGMRQKGSRCCGVSFVLSMPFSSIAGLVQRRTTSCCDSDPCLRKFDCLHNGLSTSKPSIYFACRAVELKKYIVNPSVQPFVGIAPSDLSFTRSIMGSFCISMITGKSSKLTRRVGSSVKSKVHKSLVTTSRSSAHASGRPKQLWNPTLKGLLAVSWSFS